MLIFGLVWWIYGVFFAKLLMYENYLYMQKRYVKEVH